MSEPAAVREALRRLERAVDLHLGRSAWTQTAQLKGVAYSEAVRKELYAAHDEAREVLAASPAVPPAEHLRDLVNALMNYRQADEDGTNVLVSRESCRQAADILRALYTAPPPPTLAMLEAGAQALNDAADKGDTSCVEDAEACYQAMIAASPAVPQAGVPPRVVAALRELVAVKDLKERKESYSHTPECLAGRWEDCPGAQMEEEYDRRKPLAWQEARAALTEYDAWLSESQEGGACPK